jgi:hypothetical protein
MRCICAWGMIDDTKKLFRSQRFGIVFYEVYLCLGNDLSTVDDTNVKTLLIAEILGLSSMMCLFVPGE